MKTDHINFQRGEFSATLHFNDGGRQADADHLIETLVAGGYTVTVTNVERETVTL